ncbi:hypothetical protein N7520_003616 [Penicillium odoratum]|uniref:uncharacterized protein n=1 Tax=Penicillium odoratum TaxID=1167516 RepID=UPI002549A5F3|nr:uncharacterized protein N7520_003616 [Penicillium odoratum]KAJ5769057.1 hypothetical protein N7520_003616 [Penicillium odoratum]
MTVLAIFPPIYWSLAVLFLYYIWDLVVTKRLIWAQKEHPVVGSPSWWTPRAILNLIFATKASRLLEEGYQKFKNGTFQLIRANGNIVILPLSALEELSQLPPTLASPNGALEHDLVGEYSGVNVISQSRIHHTIVQRKLTPRLPLLTPALQDELEIAITDTFPASSRNQIEDWTEIKPFHLMGQLVARLSARALVGSEFCRDPVWLDISLSFTQCLFTTVIVLRTFPTWTYSVLSRCLPSYWRGRAYLRKAQTVLGPAIQNLLKHHDEGTFTAQPTDSVMAWMIEGAKGIDRDAEMLTRSEVLLSLASVHTILIRLTNTLYDLAAHPTYIEELCAEIQDQKEKWTTDPMAAYSNLHKLDSVLRESQRLAPGTTLGLKRLLRESYRFTSISPPITVKKGTIVALPVMAIENDPAYIDEPGRYDPLRTYRRGMGPRTTSQWSNQHSYTAIDRTVLGFGYGKSACPGRFFASLVLKMVLVKLLTEFDFRLVPGTSRPRSYEVHEFLFMAPWEKLQIRRRCYTKA